MKNKGGVKLAKQNKFPYLQQFRDKFPITDETIFIYKDTIYINKTVEEFAECYDIVHHELEHLRHMREVGADKWIKLYLTSDKFRLEAELRAYKQQLAEVRKLNDKTELMNIQTECIKNISSPLYGSIISYRDAEQELS